MPCLCVSPLSGFSSPTLRRPHLSSPPAYRICCLLTLVHLQSARFPRRCPEAGKNSTASGLSLKPITTNTVCSLGHRRRPNPLSYCCVGGITCVDRLVSPGTTTLVAPCKENQILRTRLTSTVPGMTARKSKYAPLGTVEVGVGVGAAGIVACVERA